MVLEGERIMQQHYRHLFDKFSPFGGMTLVYWYSSEDPYKILYQYSICSLDDHYSRKIGIYTATLGKLYEVKAYEDQDICSTILEDILTSHPLPVRDLRMVWQELQEFIFKRYMLEERRVRNLLSARLEYKR